MQSLLGLGITKIFTLFMSKGFAGIGRLILCFFYNAFKAVAWVIEFVEALFKRLAGIEQMGYNGQSIGGDNSFDLLFAFLTNSTVQSTFFLLLSFSVVLLVILTIVAMVKSEFTMDVAGAAKGPILARAFKAILQFFIVPIFVLIGVVASNALTKVVYTVSKADAKSISAYCFRVGAYSANRARNDEQFAQYLIKGYFMKSGTSTSTSTSDAIANPFQNATTENVADYVDAYMTGIEDKIKEDYGAAKGTTKVSRTLNNENVDVYAVNLIDFYEYSLDDVWDMWEEGKLPSSVSTDKLSTDSSFWKEDDGEKYYVAWQTYISGTPKIKSVDNAKMTPYLDSTLVNYFYDLSKFDYILAIGCGCVLAWNFLNICLGLLKRIFEMTILFMLSPAVIAMGPLDNGSAYGKWKGMIYSRLFAVVGPLFAYNIFFVIVDLISQVHLFPTGKGIFTGILNEVADVFFHTIAIIVGAGMLKTTAKFISDFLGVEDLMSSGAGMMDKAVGTTKRAALMTAGTLGAIGMAGRTAGNALKQGGQAVGGAIRGTASMIKTGYRKATGHLTSDEAKKLRENKGKLKDLESDMERLAASNGADDPYSADYHDLRKAQAEAKRLEDENKELEGKISRGDVHKNGRSALEKKIADAQEVLNNPNASDFYKQYAKWDLENAQEELAKFDEKDKKYNASRQQAASRTVKAFAGEKWNSAKNAGKQIKKSVMGYDKDDGTHVNGIWDGIKEAGHIVMPAGDMKDGWKAVMSRFAGGVDAKNNDIIKFAKNFTTADGRRGFYQSEFEKKQIDDDVKKRKEKRAKEKEEEKEKEAQYKERAEQVMDLLKQYITHKMGEDKEAEYKDLLNKRTMAMGMGDRKTVEKMNADIKKFEADNGLDASANEVKTKILNGDGNAQNEFESYKARIQAQAFKDALEKLKENDLKMKIDTEDMPLNMNLDRVKLDNTKMQVDTSTPLNVKMDKENTIGTEIKGSKGFAEELSGEIGKVFKDNMSKITSGQESLQNLIKKINGEDDMNKV